MSVAAPGQLNVQELPPMGSRTVDCFRRSEKIGEGTYGQVFMAKDIETGETVALKRLRMDNEKEGFPITAIREIKLLKKLHHENVVELKEIVTSAGPEKEAHGNPDVNMLYKGEIYMVFEYMDHDLTGLLRTTEKNKYLKFSVPQIKCYIKQLLTGLKYCHENQVLHRDIKGSNLLINNEGILKLADFGLARSCSFDHTADLTNRVITLWYRPPELLLGAKKYGPAVDMWSVGCIFAELLHGHPVFPGKNEAEQIDRIFDLCGAPDEAIWPGVTKLPLYNNYKPKRPIRRHFREYFEQFDRQALQLVEKMLTLDPAKRITAKEALEAEYFRTDPLPCDPKSLPKYEASHELQTKNKRPWQGPYEEVHPPSQAQVLTRPCRPNHNTQQYSRGTNRGNRGERYGHLEQGSHQGRSGGYSNARLTAPYGSSGMSYDGQRGGAASGYTRGEPYNRNRAYDGWR